MAIEWGAAKGNFRLGIDIVGNTWILYGQSIAYGHSWNYTIQFSGAWGSGTKTGHFSSAYAETRTVELHRTTRTNVTQTNAATLTSVLVSGASVSRSITVTPKPAAPRVDRVVRNSDTSHRIEWTRNATATSVRVERRTNGGAWTHVGSVSSNAASYTDTSTKVGNRYQYRVRVANAGGTSDWSNLSNVIYTTPPVPTAITAVRVGDDIRVNGSIHANATHVDIQDDGATVVSALAKGSLPWTHSSPSPTETHRYRARSRVASGTSNGGTLVSGWSGYSSTVQLTASPNAPTGLAPNGVAVPVDERVTLSWQHNPVDSSDLTGFEFRYRVPGGAWETATWTGSSWSGTYRVTASRWASMIALGNVIEWQARTRGAHPDYGAWSATAVMTVISRPLVTVVSPQPGEMHDARLSASWEFFQAEDRPQSSWRARLLRDASVVETRNGSGAASSVTFRTVLENDSTYTVEVEAATGGVWSDPDSVTVDVSFILPVPGELAGVWNEQTGSMELEVTADVWRRGVAREESGARVFVEF